MTTTLTCAYYETKGAPTSRFIQFSPILLWDYYVIWRITACTGNVWENSTGQCMAKIGENFPDVPRRRRAPRSKGLDACFNARTSVVPECAHNSSTAGPKYWNLYVIWRITYILQYSSACIPMLRKLKYITQYLYSKFVFFKIFSCICMAIYDLSDCMSVIRHMTYILVIP